MVESEVGSATDYSSRKGDHFELLGVSVPIWEVDENNSAASSCAQPVSRP